MINAFSYICTVTQNTHTYIKLQNLYNLKRSCDVAKKNIIWCIWCNAMCLCGLRFKKYFLKRVDFYKSHHSEKRGVL